MLRHSLDSTLTIKTVNVFKNQGLRSSEDFDRKNSSENGFTLTRRAKNKIRQYISGYFLEQDFKGSNLLWITLTVPPDISGNEYVPEIEDKLIVNRLSQYLQNLRKNHGLKDYIWTAERQDGKRNEQQGVEKEATNTIHFHCIFDFEKYIPVENLNLYWLSLMNKERKQVFSRETLKKKEYLFDVENTYARHKDGIFKDYPEHQLEYNQEFREKVKAQAYLDWVDIGNRIDSQDFMNAFYGIDPMTINPNHPLCKVCLNPLDLEKVSLKEFTVKDGKKYTAFERLSMYMTKYITKNDSVIYARPWAASRGFSRVNYEIELDDNQVDEIVNTDLVTYTSETSFEIGTTKFTTRYYSLDYEKFKTHRYFYDLMDWITTQRMNEPDYSQIKDLPFDEQMKQILSEMGCPEKSSRSNVDKVMQIDPHMGMFANFGFDQERDEPEKPLTYSQADLFDVPEISKEDHKAFKYKNQDTRKTELHQLKGFYRKQCELQGKNPTMKRSKKIELLKEEIKIKKSELCKN